MALIDLTGWAIYPPYSGVALSGAGYQTAALDAAEELACCCIVVPKTGTIQKVGIRLTARAAGDAVYRVTLETVLAAVGVPVSNAYATRTLYVASAESADFVVPAAAGVQWIALNGATGVSATAGDLMSIVIRCVSRSTGSITVAFGSYSSLYSANDGYPYWYTYLGSSGAVGATTPLFALEYTGEIVPTVAVTPAPIYTVIAWDSGDDPTFRGLKFTLPFKAVIGGVIISALDADYDFKIHAFQSDEYTEFPDFPITWTSEIRRADAVQRYTLNFKTPFTVDANVAYRIAIEPIETGAGAVTWQVIDVTDDGAVPAMAAVDGGVNLVYTTINDVPSSGSHAWTETATRRPQLALLVKQIDDGKLGISGSGAVTKEAGAGARGGSGTAIKLNPSSTTVKLSYAFLVPVTASTESTLSFYHRITASYNGTVKVTVYDSDDDATVLLNAESVSFTDDTAYHQYTSTGFTPTDTGFCRVQIDVLDGATTGDVYIDDITVT